MGNTWPIELIIRCEWESSNQKTSVPVLILFDKLNAIYFPCKDVRSTIQAKAEESQS